MGNIGDTRAISGVSEAIFSQRGWVAMKGLNGEGPQDQTALRFSSTDSFGRLSGLTLWLSWMSCGEEITTWRESSKHIKFCC